MSAKQGRALESDVPHSGHSLPTTHPGCRGSTGEHHQSGLQRRGPYFMSPSSSWGGTSRPSSRRMVSPTPSIPFSVPCHVFLHPARGWDSRWRWKNEGFGSVLALTCHSPKSKSLTCSWYPPHHLLLSGDYIQIPLSLVVPLFFPWNSLSTTLCDLLSDPHRPAVPTHSQEGPSVQELPLLVTPLWLKQCVPLGTEEHP